MPRAAGQGGKNIIKKALRRFIKGPAPEVCPLLSNKDRSKGNQCLKKFKEHLTFEVPITNSIKRKNKGTLDDEVQEGGISKEEKLKSLIDKNQYYDACLLIHDVEQTGQLDSSELYDVLAQEMWGSLTLALDGDHNRIASLQFISQCIQWTKQQKDNKGPDWRPQNWGTEMERLFENDIKKRSPRHDPKRGLHYYLEELEKNISDTILRLERFPEVLTAAYLKCLHVVLLSHLTSLVNEKQKYEEYVLLLKWAHKEHRRLCVLRVGSENFDPLLFGNWFSDSGNKIVSARRDIMYRTFVEILQSEIVWISYPKHEVRYYFTDVLEEGTRIRKAVEVLGDTIVSRLQSLFWEEFLHFVTRYKTFLTEKLGGLTSENGICVGIRIVKNCCILRNTMNNLDAAPQDPGIQRIRRLLGECENKGIDLILSNLKPSLKEAFKNYFRKNCGQYESVLRSLKRMIVKEDIQNDQTLVTLIHHRLVVLFIHSFLKWSKKLSNQNAGEIFSNGSKKLQDFFSDMVLDNHLLPSNPLNFISEMLTANDHQALRTTTIFFIEEHQDLREEHLIAILNIKGNLSSKDKEDLLYYIRNRVMDRGQNKLRFFEGIQKDHSRLKDFLCCLF
ncbi:uncharacterized protein LOC130295223 [Hyla sarda]|uniref:uncharacterized protein LOC130295223 n=1 Tax=Hyla sarda TaxID=327740 RepID=UPI0024C2CDB3|nr:uncharacterized protein LOC130295223 [Hyla sarda]